MVGNLEATFETGSGRIAGKDSVRIRRYPGVNRFLIRYPRVRICKVPRHGQVKRSPW